MGARQRAWARSVRFQLTFLLGGVCIKCKTDKDLEFDCIIPQGDEHHKMEISTRMSFYRRMFKESNLQLLCEKCHAQKTKQDMKRNPF